MKKFIYYIVIAAICESCSQTNGQNPSPPQPQPLTYEEARKENKRTIDSARWIIHQREQTAAAKHAKKNSKPTGKKEPLLIRVGN